MHLEDRMQEMYFKSLMLAEYIKGVRSHSQQQLTAMLGWVGAAFSSACHLVGFVFTYLTPTPPAKKRAKQREKNDQYGQE